MRRRRIRSVKKLCYLLLLLVSLLLTQLHFFSCHTFLLLQQKLQSAKYNAKGNAKYNAKRSSELRGTKKAENDALVAQGIGIDAALRPDVVEMTALKVV